MDKFNKLCKELKLKNKNNYLVIDKINNEDAFLDRLASLLNSGIDFVEFDPTTLPPQKAIQLGQKIQQLCTEFNTTFVITERADIAFTLEADGIILSINSFTPHQAKEILGEKALIGIVCTNTEELNFALKNDYDFIKTLNFVKTEIKSSKKIFSHALELKNLE